MNARVIVVCVAASLVAAMTGAAWADGPKVPAAVVTFAHAEKPPSVPRGTAYVNDLGAWWKFRALADATKPGALHPIADTVAVEKATALLKTPGAVQFSTAEELRTIVKLGRVRPVDNDANSLVWLNISAAVRAVTSDPNAWKLEMTPWLPHLGLTIDDLPNHSLVYERIGQLAELQALVLHSISDSAPWSDERLLSYLRAAGLPAIPVTVTAPRVEKVPPLEQAWVVDLSLELGLKKPLTVPAFPVADFATGAFFPPGVCPLDIGQQLRLRVESGELAMQLPGGLDARVDRFKSHDGQLSADVSVAIPVADHVAGVGPRLMLTGLTAVPAADGKSLHWSVDTLDLTAITPAGQIDVKAVLNQIGKNDSNVEVRFDAVRVINADPNVNLVAGPAPATDAAVAATSSTGPATGGPGTGGSATAAGDPTGVAVAALASTVCADPYKWLQAALDRKLAVDPTIPTAVEVEVILWVGPDRLVIGPVNIGNDGVARFSTADAKLTVWRTNAEVLEQLLERLPLDPTSIASGKVATVMIDGAVVQPNGSLRLSTRVSMPLLQNPLPVTVDLPLQPGAGTAPAISVAWEEAVAKVMVGQKVQLGTLLSAKIVAGPSKAGWRATVCVGDGPDLPVRIELTANGPVVRPDIGFQEAATKVAVSALQSWVALLGQGGLSVSPGTVRLVTTGKGDGEKQKSEAGVEFDATFAGTTVTVRVNEGGIRLIGVDNSTLHRWVADRLATLTDGFPLQIKRADPAGDSLEFDADLLWAGQPLITVVGARMVAGKLVSPGVVTISDDVRASLFKELNWKGDGWSMAVRSLRLDQRGRPVIGLCVDVDTLGTLRIDEFPLTSPGPELEQLAGPVLHAIRKRLSDPAHKQVPLKVGPLEVSARLDDSVPPDPVTLNFKLTAALPARHLSITFPKAWFDLKHGLVPGDAAVDGLNQLLTQLTVELGNQFKGIEDVQVSNVSVQARSVRDLAVTFDFEAALPAPGRGKIRVLGNRIDGDGVHVGKVDGADAVGATAGELGLFGTVDYWKNHDTIEVGTFLRVTRKSLEVGPPLKLVGQLDVNGGRAGEITVTTGGPKGLSVELGEPKTVFENIRKALPELPGGMDAIRAGTPTVDQTGVTLPFEVRLPVVDEFVPGGSIRMGTEGVKVVGTADAWRQALWPPLAKRLSGKSLSVEGFPLSLKVTSANARGDGVDIDASVVVLNLEPTTVSARFDRAGFHVEAAAIESAISEKLIERVRTAVPSGVITIAGVRVNKGDLAVDLKVDLGQGDPITLTVTVGPQGVNLDTGKLLDAALTRIADKLSTAKLSLPGGASLTVIKARVVDHKLSLDGELKICGGFGLKANNILFDLRSFDLSKMKDLQVTGLAERLGALMGPGKGWKVDATFDGIRFTGVKVTVPIKIAVLEGSADVGISTTEGFKLYLPVTLTLKNGVIPIPPYFKLSEPRATLSAENVVVGCLFSPAATGAEQLIKFNASLQFPFKEPWVVRGIGDLTLLSFVPIGHQESVLSFPDKKFSSRTRIELKGVVCVDGNLEAQLDPMHVALDGSAKMFGASIGDVNFVVDMDHFEGGGMVSLLLAKARAHADGRWDHLRQSKFDAKVDFRLPTPWGTVDVASAGVGATLAPEAWLTASVLGKSIRLPAVDLSGITLERLADLFLNDQIFPTGMKLLSSGGAGGTRQLKEDGTMLATYADGSARCLYTDHAGHVQMATSRPDGKGGRTFEVTDVSNNTVTIMHAGVDGIVVAAGERAALGNTDVPSQTDRHTNRPAADDLPPDLLPTRH